MPETAPASPDAPLALAFAANPRVAALAPLAKIDAEIAASTRADLDHAVGHARLEWWRGEIGRLAAGSPRHPLCVELLKLGGEAPDYGLLLERVTAAELALVGYAPHGQVELLAYIGRSHGARETLAAQLLAAGRSESLATYGARLGRGFGLLEALVAGDDALLGELPREQLLTRARLALASAPAALALPERAAQAHGLVRAALALARLDRSGAAPGSLRLLWLAWRTARRAQRE